jgi:thymidylate kinase
MEKKRSMFIVIEGTDNTGKDTQQNLIIERLHDRVFHKVHYSSLPFKDKEKHTTHSAEMYDQMFRTMKSLADQNISVIFNRSHLGESVYAPLYRGYSGDFVFDIEKKHIGDIQHQVFLITLVNDPNRILSRDDGKSLYKDAEGVQAEIDGFVRAHRKSGIKNKLLVDVGTMGPEEVSNIIVQFLTDAQPEYNEAQQLIDFT